VIAERLDVLEQSTIGVRPGQVPFLDGLWVTPAELPAASAGVHTSSGRFSVFRWGGVPEVCENLLYKDQEGPRIRI
jgi:hypothetical protein